MDELTTHSVITKKNIAQLQLELEAARQNLLEAEASLAKEQAEINAFRMHCRLKLDRWIEQLLELQTKKQSLLTRLELLRQSQTMDIPLEEAESFWKNEADWDELSADEDEGELILPTDVPRDKAAEKRLYRELAQRFHPDLGMTSVDIAYRTEMMTAVNSAYEAGDIQAMYDLAGELDPEQIAELAKIDSIDERKMREEIYRLHLRRRRAKQRLTALYQENTARLWKKARYLEQDDTHWWEVVRLEIERHLDRLGIELEQLKSQIVVIEDNIFESPA
jgi:hypothetical protein